MQSTPTRYPGAQPFSDSDASRRTFFGRERDAAALTDQILANRLVVVYAKSGLGKTSLLNAGVAPLLRGASSLPLLVRVNDIKRGPLESVLEGVGSEAKRQGVEYVEGESQSLWSFFKTVEFWRGDLLLTPVLVFDQFEELFTLQPEPARESFLAELGYLIRGVPPPSLEQTGSGRSAAPPSVRVVLSLREDFLGILEEAANHVPQILDHRFRLTPLSCEAASLAITEPAAIDDPSLATRPFQLDPNLVTAILSYLGRSATGVRASQNRYIEPFHLQLICQRMEQLAAVKQKKGEPVVLSLEDLGGETGLTETLVSFYANAIRALPEKHLRPAARRMCEQYLISPEGRRLSVEEREIQRQLRLPATALHALVDSRLLRTDRRSESTYYELSHDALVQPVLASRRTQALVVGWAQAIAGWAVAIAMAVMIVLVGFVVVSTTNSTGEIAGEVFVILLAIPIMSFGVRWLRSGNRVRERYRRRTPEQVAEPLPALRPGWYRITSWLILGMGTVPAAIVPFGVGYLAVSAVFLARGIVPAWLADDDWFQAARVRPWLELPWIGVELLVFGLAGWILIRQGCRRLWPRTWMGRSKPAYRASTRRRPCYMYLSSFFQVRPPSWPPACLGSYCSGVVCCSGNPSRLAFRRADHLRYQECLHSRMVGGCRRHCPLRLLHVCSCDNHAVPGLSLARIAPGLSEACPALGAPKPEFLRVYTNPSKGEERRKERSHEHQTSDVPSGAGCCRTGSVLDGVAAQTSGASAGGEDR